jgi:hypothetical protein
MRGSAATRPVAATPFRKFLRTASDSLKSLGLDHDVMFLDTHGDRFRDIRPLHYAGAGYDGHVICLGPDGAGLQ